MEVTLRKGKFVCRSTMTKPENETENAETNDTDEDGAGAKNSSSELKEIPRPLLGANTDAKGDGDGPEAGDERKDEEEKDASQDEEWETEEEYDEAHDVNGGVVPEAIRAPFPGEYVVRKPDPDLPETVTKLESLEGGTVYVVGTAHFSEQSQDDVTKTISEVQPDIVVVELCASRVNILQLDEETLLKEASDINMEKMRNAIKQSGFVQGLLHLLLLSMSAHLTKQLGMAPGGEFRRAFKEAMQIPGCRVHLGDRPIQVTLRRALSSLTVWQKCKLGWALLWSKDPISKEEVEKCKQKDLLEEMLREMTGEFPALSRVFVSERDQCLAHSLRNAAKPLNTQRGLLPAVVVGVVGMGHVSGIKEHFDENIEISELMQIPPPSRFSSVFSWTRRLVILAVLGYAGYRTVRFGHYACGLFFRTIKDSDISKNFTGLT